MKHLMIDLETMSVQPTAAIVALGAVFFDLEEGLGDSFYRTITLVSNEECGRHLGASTVNWWLTQTTEARQELITAMYTLPQALQQFSTWLEEHPTRDGPFVWGNGSDFDNLILRNAYEALKLPCPWSYRANRCFRTMTKCYPRIELLREGEAHVAINDARHQAKYLIKLAQENGLKF